MVSTDDPVLLSLTSILGPPTYTTSDEVRFESPFTDKFHDPSKSDRKKHLYVNPRKGKFCCFKSGMAGSIGYLFHVLGLEDVVEIPVSASATSWDNLRDKCLSVGTKAVFSQEFAALPEWYSTVKPGSNVHQYLLGRNVPDDDIEYYSIGEGTGQWEDWLVVPSFGDTGVCEYWVSRNIHKKDYRNPPSDKRYHVVFLSLARKTSPTRVTVCEGVFSAIAAGRAAVATLGKMVTTLQLQKLKTSGVAEILLALDGDAWEETLDTAENALKIGLAVSIVPLPPDKDPDDLGRETFAELVSEKAFRVDAMKLLKLRVLET